MNWYAGKSKDHLENRLVNNQLILPYVLATAEGSYHLQIARFCPLHDPHYGRRREGTFQRQSYYHRPATYIYYLHRYDPKEACYDLTLTHVNCSKCQECQNEEHFEFWNGTAVSNIHELTRRHWVASEAEEGHVVITTSFMPPPFLVLNDQWPTLNPLELTIKVQWANFAGICGPIFLNVWEGLKNHVLSKVRWVSTSEQKGNNLLGFGTYESWDRRIWIEDEKKPGINSSFPCRLKGYNIPYDHRSTLKIPANWLVKTYVFLKTAKETVVTGIVKSVETVINTVQNVATGIWDGIVNWVMTILYAALAVIGCIITIVLLWKVFWLFMQKYCLYHPYRKVSEDEKKKQQSNQRTKNYDIIKSRKF